MKLILLILSFALNACVTEIEKPPRSEIVTCEVLKDCQSKASKICRGKKYETLKTSNTVTNDANGVKTLINLRVACFTSRTQ